MISGTTELGSYSLASLGFKMEKEARNTPIGKHVAWLKEPRTGAKHVAVTMLIALEVFALSISLVGIIAIVKAKLIENKLDKAEILKKKSDIVTPPEDAHVEMKSKTETFNHKVEYAIHDKVLWYKGKDSNKEWKLFYFDGYVSGAVPKEIQADGANLIVVDDKKEVHYKKVLQEYRRNHKYQSKDLTEEDNWIDRWFSFPLFEKIYHIFAEKRLKLPDNVVGCAMSHRGKYTNYFTDIRGKKHPEFAMVTSFYAVIKDDPDIYFADPFLMQGFKHKIKGPNPNFKIESISASASVILLSGKLDGKTKRYFRMADFDTEGKNPFLAAFYTKKCRPDENWHELPDLEGKFGLSLNSAEQISIYQDGEGNDARVIQVKINGEIFQKKIGDTDWTRQSAQF
jgi:hypothetical protein